MTRSLGVVGVSLPVVSRKQATSMGALWRCGIVNTNRMVLSSTRTSATKGRGAGTSRERTEGTETLQLPFGVQLDMADPKAKATITTYIPIFIVFCILMYLDAAFSGDWSRIGVITKEQEEFLKSFFVISVSIHGMLGLAAGAISLKRGEKIFLQRAVKTFIVGIVAFAEVWYLTEEDL